MADIELTKETNGNINPETEGLKQDNQPKGYLQNTRGWVNDKMSSTKNTDQGNNEKAYNSEIKESPGYLQSLPFGWVKDKIYGVSNSNTIEKDIITKTPDSDIVKPSGYLQYASLGWVKEKMSGGINPFVTQKGNGQIKHEPEGKEENCDENKPPGYLSYLSLGWVKDKMSGGINPVVTQKENGQIKHELEGKEDVNDKSKPPGYISYLSFGWVKDKMYGKTNTNPYDICAVPTLSKEDQNISYGVWDSMIYKAKVKEYMPDMKTVENTSDVVKTVGELTGFPFLQGIGTIVNKCCKLSRQVTVLGNKVEDDSNENIEVDTVTTITSNSNENILYSDVIEKLKSGEMNFELVKFILEMSEFREHKLKDLYKFPHNLYYRSSYSTFIIMSNIYQRDEDYIYRRRRFW